MELQKRKIYFDLVKAFSIYVEHRENFTLKERERILEGFDLEEKEISFMYKFNKFFPAILETSGFVKAYFEMLPEYSTSLETFNVLNDLFERKTGKKRFNDFATFKNALGMN